MPTPPSQGQLLYHITHVDNLPSILEHGLMSRYELSIHGITNFEDIANHEILSKRDAYQRALSHYVLFHFYPKNPFDGSVCQTYGSENMALITIPRALHLDYKFYIIPSHPLDINTPDIYPYNEGINLIKWDILDRTQNRNYLDPEIRKACMAECLTESTISPNLFSYIYVKNEKTRLKIESMPNSSLVKVIVNPYMFP